MSSMIKQHLSEDEISNSLTYQWLEDSNKRTIKNLGETPDKTQKVLTAFLKEKNIKTTNPENLAQLIITLWIRYKQAIDMVKYPEYKKERKKLESVIEKAKQLIGQIN